MAKKKLTFRDLGSGFVIGLCGITSNKLVTEEIK